MSYSRACNRGVFRSDRKLVGRRNAHRQPNKRPSAEIDRTDNDRGIWRGARACRRRRPRRPRPRRRQWKIMNISLDILGPSASVRAHTARYIEYIITLSLKCTHVFLGRRNSSTYNITGVQVASDCDVKAVPTFENLKYRVRTTDFIFNNKTMGRRQ